MASTIDTPAVINAVRTVASIIEHLPKKTVQSGHWYCGSIPVGIEHTYKKVI